MTQTSGTMKDGFVVVLEFYVPPTSKVIRRRDLGLKSHPKDWRRLGSNSRPQVYKVSSLTATPWRLLRMVLVVNFFVILKCFVFFASLLYVI